MMARILSVILLAVGVVVACGGDDEEESPGTSACAAVCQRFGDCYSTGGYDVPGCVSRCEGELTRDSEFESTVTHCDACAAGRSCSDAFRFCIAECAEVPFE
jgi:hypothetical protein